MNLNNLPPENRPREKALKYGISTLSDVELIALILGSGYQGNDVLSLANELILKVQGLANLINYNEQELMQIKGIKKVKAIRFFASIELAKRIKINSIKSKYYLDYVSTFIDKIGDKKQEHLFMLSLNRKKHVIKEKLISISSSNNIIIFTKEILKIASSFSYKNVVLVHNHPSTICFPSDDDVINSVSIKKDLMKLGINLVDHIIVTKENAYSIFMKKLIF